MKKMLSPSDQTKLLPKETAELYQIVSKSRSGSRFIDQYGTFNLKELTVRQAEALVKLKCPWIAERKKPTSGSNDKGSDT
jgi:hypothetical protein